MKESEILRRIQGGRCQVLGYGVSNRPLVNWLLTHGAASVTVREKRPLAVMEENGDAQRIRGAGAGLICGEGYLEGLSGDVIFRTPGMRPDLPELVQVVSDGAVLSSEMVLLFLLILCNTKMKPIQLFLLNLGL